MLLTNALNPTVKTSCVQVGVAGFFDSEPSAAWKEPPNNGIAVPEARGQNKGATSCRIPLDSSLEGT